MTMWRRASEIAARLLQSKGQRRDLFVRSSVVFCFTVVFMTIYQAMRSFLHTDITFLQAHVETIFFTSLVAGLAAYYVLKRQETLLYYATTELKRRKEAEEQLLRERSLLEMVTLNVAPVSLSSPRTIAPFGPIRR